MAGQMIGFAEIAEKMGVVLRHARIAVSSDPDFPEPLTPPGFRSPGWDEGVIDAYLETRTERSLGRVGRPPATAEGRRVKLSAEQNGKVRRLVRGHGSIAAASRVLGISEVTMRTRLNGRSSWVDAEFPKLARHLGVSESELRGE
mgnify:FL=1